MGYPHYAQDCGEHHGLVADFKGPRTRFAETFRDQNLRLTLQGKIVLSVGCDTKSDSELFPRGVPDDIKIELDELHKRKIDLADLVLVLNVGGYIGESTRSEIEYAKRLPRVITYLEPPAEVAS